MNCTEFKAVFERSLETRGTLDAMAREHVASCSSCRAQWDVQRQLNATIEAWQAEAGIDALSTLSPKYVRPLMETLRRDAAPLKLAGSVLKELNISRHARTEHAGPEPAEIVSAEVKWRKDSTNVAEIQPGRPESPQPLVAAPPRAGGIAVLVAAACLLFAVMFTSQPSHRPMPPSPEVATVPPQQLTEPDGVDVSETLTAVLSDLQSEYQEMATETSSAASDLAKVIPVGSNPLSHYVPEHPYPEDFKIRPTSVDAARIWRPISTKVETALGFLWNTVPSQVPAG